MTARTGHHAGLDPAAVRRRVAEVVRALQPRPVPVGGAAHDGAAHDGAARDGAAGTVLAATLWARNPLPAFDCSAMDGYAVRGPGPWRLLGSTLAGDPPAAPLPDGGAVAVATGAALPDGCDGVLRTEDAVTAGDETVGVETVGVEIIGLAPHGRDVRRRGEECAPWTPVLPAGTVLTPAALALAAALGHDTLLVHDRPRVALLVTGRELLTAGDPGAGRIRDALGPLLVPAVRDAGGCPLVLRLLGDDSAVLAAALAGCRGSGVDLVVSTGGTADGPADGVRAALATAGAALVVDGLATRPGRPTLLSLLPDGTPVLSLPGNPLAALVGFVVVGMPVLAALRAAPPPAACRARLVTGLSAHPSSIRVVPVRRAAAGAGAPAAALPTGHDGSANLRGAALADGLALVPPGDDLPAGAEVDVLDLPGTAPAWCRLRPGDRPASGRLAS